MKKVSDERETMADTIKRTHVYEVRSVGDHYEVVHVRSGKVIKRYRDIGLARRMAVALTWEAKKQSQADA